MYGSNAGNRQFRIALAERIFTWFLGRGDIVEWLDQALLERGPDLFAELDRLTALEVGRFLLGMEQWQPSHHRTVGGAGSDVETFFTKKLAEEVEKDSFLSATIGKNNTPVTGKCLSMIGETVKRTRFYAEHATDMRRRVRNTKTVREVMIT